MAGITSKVDICNMASGYMGNYGSVNNIDTPQSDMELTYALWYDIIRQKTLKALMPNFALARRNVARLVNQTVAFGYANAYQYPRDCLKLLGIGDIDQSQNTYNVEGNVIYTDALYGAGMPIRFLLDVTDVNAMSPEFKTYFALELADATVMAITQSTEKAKDFRARKPGLMMEVSSLNAQENKPIRISNSRIAVARRWGRANTAIKR